MVNNVGSFLRVKCVFCCFLVAIVFVRVSWSFLFRDVACFLSLGQVRKLIGLDHSQ